MTEQQIDPQKQSQAKQLARIKRRVMVGELALGLIYSVSWLVLGWSETVKQALMSLTTNQWLLVFLFAAIFGGIYALITLPILYYESFVLPHRYGLSTQSFGAWVIDQIKGAALAVVLGVLIIEFMYAILRAAPETWWLWFGLILLLFNVVMANLASVLLLPIFYKFQPLGEDYSDLTNRLMRLAQNAHTHVEGIYKFDMSSKTTTANAALTGLGKTRRIILGDTLLDEFSGDEIETILAHELAHHVYRDIPIGILFQSLVTLGGLYLASIVLSWGTALFGFDGPADVAAMPLLVLALGFYGLLTMPLENAYSRWRERRADRYALQATGKGAAYASALTRLANQNLSQVDPNPIVEFFLYSHPALGKRIAMAEAYTSEDNTTG